MRGISVDYLVDYIKIYVKAGGSQVGQTTSLLFQIKFRIVKLTQPLHSDGS